MNLLKSIFENTPLENEFGFKNKSELDLSEYLPKITMPHQDERLMERVTPILDNIIDLVTVKSNDDFTPDSISLDLSSVNNSDYDFVDYGKIAREESLYGYIKEYVNEVINFKPDPDPDPFGLFPQEKPLPGFYPKKRELWDEPELPRIGSFNRHQPILVELPVIQKPLTTGIQLWEKEYGKTTMMNESQRKFYNPSQDLISTGPLPCNQVGAGMWNNGRGSSGFNSNLQAEHQMMNNPPLSGMNAPGPIPIIQYIGQ